MKRILAVLLLFASGCSGPFTDLHAAPATAERTFIGWLKYHGEFLLYDSRRSFEAGEKSPHCISGVFPKEVSIDLAKYDGRKVEIRGRLVRYAVLPLEARPVLPRKVLAGSIVPNFCFGDDVLLASSIRELEKD